MSARWRAPRGPGRKRVSIDVDKLKAMVHVKDEDIAALDAVVVAKEGARP